MLKENMKKIATFANDHKGDAIQWVTLITITAKAFDTASGFAWDCERKIRKWKMNKELKLLKEMHENGYCDFYYKDHIRGTERVSCTPKMAYNEFLNGKHEGYD